MSSWPGKLAALLPRVLVVGHDLLMVWICWTGLVYLRYSYVQGAVERPWFSTEHLIVLLAQGLVFWMMGLYRGLWRFASVADLWNIARACALGLVAIGAGLFLYNRLNGVPRAALEIGIAHVVPPVPTAPLAS